MSALWGSDHIPSLPGSLHSSSLIESSFHSPGPTIMVLPDLCVQVSWTSQNQSTSENPKGRTWALFISVSLVLTSTKTQWKTQWSIIIVNTCWLLFVEETLLNLRCFPTQQSVWLSPRAHTEHCAKEKQLVNVVGGHLPASTRAEMSTQSSWFQSLSFWLLFTATHACVYSLAFCS